MVQAPPQSVKLPSNVATPRTGVELVEYLTKFQKAPENDLFTRVMGNEQLISFTLAPGNEYVFNTFRSLMGKTEETKHNRTLVDIAIEPNSEVRYEKLRNIICELKPYQMSVIYNVLRNLFNYYHSLKNKAMVCGDPGAKKVYDLLINGDPTVPGSSDTAEAERKGLLGQWKIDRNDVVGQILVGLGVIEEKELLDYLHQRDFEHKAARKEVHGCPICHGVHPEEDMLKTATKPYGTIVWMCMTCYDQEKSKGENSIIQGEPIATVAARPKAEPAPQTLDQVIHSDIIGKLYYKPAIPAETQVEIGQHMIDNSRKVALASVQTAIEQGLERVSQIMKEKHVSKQKAITIWRLETESLSEPAKPVGEGKMTKGISKKTGVNESTPDTLVEQLKARISDCGSRECLADIYMELDNIAGIKEQEEDEIISLINSVYRNYPDQSEQ